MRGEDLRPDRARRGRRWAGGKAAGAEPADHLDTIRAAKTKRSGRTYPVKTIFRFKFCASQPRALHQRLSAARCFAPGPNPAAALRASNALVHSQLLIKEAAQSCVDLAEVVAISGGEVIHCDECFDLSAAQLNRQAANAVTAAFHIAAHPPGAGRNRGGVGVGGHFARLAFRAIMLRHSGGSKHPSVRYQVERAVLASRREERAIEAAKIKVRPLVGDLSDLAFDSAAAVYGRALGLRGRNLRGIHPSAYREMVNLELEIARREALDGIRRGTSRRQASLAADAALGRRQDLPSLVEAFPAVANIGRARV
jgi:hypothetical protein